MNGILLRRLALSAALAGLFAGALSGCVPLVVGGAMAGGSLVATDRRTSGTQVPAFAPASATTPMST